MTFSLSLYQFRKDTDSETLLNLSCLQYLLDHDRTFELLSMTPIQKINNKRHWVLVEKKFADVETVGTQEIFSLTATGEQYLLSQVVIDLIDKRKRLEGHVNNIYKLIDELNAKMDKLTVEKETSHE